MIDVERPADTLAYLLGLPAETATIEFKRMGKGLDKIAQSICAFANMDGGWLVLGLGDPARSTDRYGLPEDRLFGVEENPTVLDDWKQSLGAKFVPPLNLTYHTLPCRLGSGRLGHLCLIEVERSERVHSIIGGGTWTRGGASNRQLSAEETATLSLRRGERSAESDLLPIPVSLLETPVWETFLRARGLRPGNFGELLTRIGLAEYVSAPGGPVLHPRRAAVLLFAEEPGSLLAAHGSRADIRVMVYAGSEIGTSELPNLKKPPRTLRGPLVELIENAVQAVTDELAQGLTRAGSGFRTVHKYPPRVINEAIVNAVIHRDYRLNRDIVIRILDDRIIIESPGLLPGRITPANIKAARSKARNPLIAQNLREFPTRPNFDDGEGVRMMYHEMQLARLYEPIYREFSDTAVELVELTLLNEERPEAWAEVSDWIDRHGPIANAKVCEIAKVDTLRASKMLRAWVDRGLLVPLEGRGRRNAAYGKAGQTQE